VKDSDRKKYQLFYDDGHWWFISVAGRVDASTNRDKAERLLAGVMRTFGRTTDESNSERRNRQRRERRRKSKIGVDLS